MDELGPRLRDARVAKNLTLEDVAHATKIPKSSLAALEAGRFETLPAPVFVRGFIRAYARVVGTDPNPLVRIYEATARPPEPPEDKSLTVGPRTAEARAGSEPSRIEKRLDPERKLVPLQPVSEHRQGGFRGGFALLAVVAVGLLVAAWLLVGGKPQSLDTNARAPTAPVMHERIDGLPSLDATPATRASPR